MTLIPFHFVVTSLQWLPGSEDSLTDFPHSGWNGFTFTLTFPTRSLPEEWPSRRLRFSWRIKD
jgi:hypothetical protein